jgi:Flp pilus assembly protein protease CpaA
VSYPLHTLSLASALLLLVAAWDIARRRIPNWVNAALAVLGLGSQGLCHGGMAALGALGAAAVTLVVLWIPWSTRRLGGGDVKAMMGAALWLGMTPLLRFYLITALVVGPVALACAALSSAAARREMAANLKLALLRVVPEVPAAGGQGRVSVPFGAAAAVAALILLWRP